MSSVDTFGKSEHAFIFSSFFHFLCYTFFNNSIDLDITSKGSSYGETYFTVVITWTRSIGCDSKIILL
ncbi:hypothetical protein R0K19_25345, partial [Bacillus sp. SIMBA_161]